MNSPMVKVNDEVVISALHIVSVVRNGKDRCIVFGTNSNERINADVSLEAMNARIDAAWGS